MVSLVAKSLVLQSCLFHGLHEVYQTPGPLVEDNRVHGVSFTPACTDYSHREYTRATVSRSQQNKPLQMPTLMQINKLITFLHFNTAIVKYGEQIIAALY